MARDADIDGRLPPHDIDCEGAVLSACMLDGATLDRVMPILKAEHFYSERHARIFEACVELHAKGQPVDIVQVGTLLKAKGRIAQAGGMPYLTELTNAAPFVANLEAYAKTVVEKARVRKLIAVCQRIAAVGYTDYGDAAAYFNEAAQSVNDVALESVATDAGLVPLKDSLREFVNSAKSPQDRGIPSGFDRFDRMTGGWHESDLTIIAARPGMGKTSFVLNVAANIAQPPKKVGGVQWGVPVFSMEMPRLQVAGRMACAEGKVDVSKPRTGFMSQGDWSRLLGAIAGTEESPGLGALPIWVDDSAAITCLDIAAKVRRLKQQWEGSDARATRKIGVVIVDYLQLMKGSRDYRGDNREAEIAEISRGLKAIAKSLRVSVIALSQLNRQVETRAEKKKRPQLSDLRESGAIEQDADNVCFIYRDEYYNKDSEERNTAELIVAKQRNGPTGTAKVRFDAQYTRFDNLAEGEYVDGEPN